MTQIITIVAASALGFPVIATAQPASARDGAIAAGVIGGLAAGAIIGSQANRSYYNGPGYVEPSYAPVYGPVISSGKKSKTPTVVFAFASTTDPAVARELRRSLKFMFITG